MAQRSTLPPKLRFEVFKRDAFTCQYCGAAAPDVVLHADHITPIAAGGTTDLLNLITACKDCNGGKGAKLLSDRSSVQKQKGQLDELNERRLQIEMMLVWREQLKQVDEKLTVTIVKAIDEKARDFKVSETGRKIVSGWLRKHEPDHILEAVDIAFCRYLAHDANGKAIRESWLEAFDKVPRILKIQAEEVTKPYLRDMFYIRAILRNRLTYVSERDCLSLLEDAILDGVKIESLKDLARRVRSWTQFRASVRLLVEEVVSADVIIG